MRALLLVVLAGCVDQPLGPDPPAAKLVASWDPLACGERRVAIELTGDVDELQASAPCELGGLVLDVPELGTYRARVGSAELIVAIDQPVVELALDL